MTREQRTAITRIISDMIKADNIIEETEIKDMKMLMSKYSLTYQDMSNARKIRFSVAVLLPNNTYATRGDNRDKGQREFCGCMKSKDIGEYNTCVHLCEYKQTGNYE